jgi:hypothetical protein
MFTTHHPIVRAATRDPQVVVRFWASVERLQAADACWEWNGRRGGDRRPVFTVKYTSVAPARFAWFAATGQFPIGGKLRHTCENADCVRPEHLAWELGRRTERMLRARSDGYVSYSGTWELGRDLEGETWLRRAG